LKYREERTKIGRISRMKKLRKFHSCAFFTIVYMNHLLYTLTLLQYNANVDYGVLSLLIQTENSIDWMSVLR